MSAWAPSWKNVWTLWSTSSSMHPFSILLKAFQMKKTPFRPKSLNVTWLSYEPESDIFVSLFVILISEVWRSIGTYFLMAFSSTYLSNLGKGHDTERSYYPHWQGHVLTCGQNQLTDFSDSLLEYRRWFLCWISLNYNISNPCHSPKEVRNCSWHMDCLLLIGQHQPWIVRDGKV